MDPIGVGFLGDLCFRHLDDPFSMFEVALDGRLADVPRVIFDPMPVRSH